MERVLDLLVGCARMWRRGTLLAVPHLLTRPAQPPTELTDDLFSSYRSAVTMQTTIREIYKLIDDIDKGVAEAQQKLERLQSQYAEMFAAGCDLISIARELWAKAIAAESQLAHAALRNRLDETISRIRGDCTDDPVDFQLTEITAMAFASAMGCSIMAACVGADARHAAAWARLSMQSQRQFDETLEALLRYRNSVKQQS